MLDLLLEHGVNHIDTAPTYGDAELRIGPWMDRHRDDFFLATKTRERDYEGARADIHRSLERLRTDRIDLLQLHALIHPDEWEQALAPGGALEAVRAARAEGLVRFIGVTGHGWNVAAMHRRCARALRLRFDPVAVELALRPSRDLRRRFQGDAGARARARESRSRPSSRSRAGRGRPASRATTRTWYQPLEDPAEIRLAVHWVLAQPGIFLNSVGDVELLPHVLRAAAELGDGAPAALPGEAVMARFAERAGLASIFGL